MLRPAPQFYMYIHFYYTFNLHRGDSITLQRGKVSATAWLDRKVVTAMASSCQPGECGTVLRRTQDGSRVSVPCPQSIISYNTYMGGVDRGDQLRGYYRCRIKSRKFYKYIFYFLLDVAITNAFILIKHHTPNGSKVSIKNFRVNLATQLIGEYCSRRRRGRTSSSAIRPLPLRHFPVKVDDECHPGKRRRGNCSHCRKTRKVRTNTSWFCRECSEWLCHSGDSDDCFLQWHTYLDMNV